MASHAGNRADFPDDRGWFAVDRARKHRVVVRTGIGGAAAGASRLQRRDGGGGQPTQLAAGSGADHLVHRHKFHAVLITHDKGLGRVVQIVSCLGNGPARHVASGHRARCRRGLYGSRYEWMARVTGSIVRRRVRCRGPSARPWTSRSSRTRAGGGNTPRSPGPLSGCWRMV